MTGDEPVLSDEAIALGQSADRLLAAYRDLLRAAAELGERSVTLRCTAYPSQIAGFVAAAIGAFEQLGTGKVRLAGTHSCHTATWTKSSRA